MVSQGRRLIFSTAFGFMDPTVRVAREFPDFAFENATGYKTLENVAVYNARFYEGRYLAGLLAGHSSESGVIGYVAAMPIPEVLHGINAFTIAARSVNPKLEVRVIWVNSWFDAERERDAALTLISQGADLLTHHTDTVGSRGGRRAEAALPDRLQLGHAGCGANHAPGIGHSPLGPVLHQASPPGPGRYVGQRRYLGRHRRRFHPPGIVLAQSAVIGAPRNPLEQRGDRARVSCVPFTGPLKSNDGKIKLEDGVMTDDALASHGLAGRRDRRQDPLTRDAYCASARRSGDAHRAGGSGSVRRQLHRLRREMDRVLQFLQHLAGSAFGLEPEHHQRTLGDDVFVAGPELGALPARAGGYRSAGSSDPGRPSPAARTGIGSW